MAKPPMEIYQFEDQLEAAVTAYLFKNGVNDVSKMRDSKIDFPDGKVQTLKTPRVDPKFLCGGLNQNEHYYIASNGVRWLDIAVGTLYLKVVTRRDDTSNSHAYLRGLCRYLMQYVPDITNLMKYHKVEKMIETSSTTSFEADKLHDVSALTFQTWIRIRSEFFPVT